MKNKYKEVILYVFWGGATVIFGLASYSALKVFISDYKTANLISIILTKIFAYIVNKIGVFRTKNTLREDIKEIVRYIIARGSTGIVDWVGQAIMVEGMGINDMTSKIIMVIITTILNYLLCSLKVFRKE